MLMPRAAFILDGVYQAHTSSSVAYKPPVFFDPEVLKPFSKPFQILRPSLGISQDFDASYEEGETTLIDPNDPMNTANDAIAGTTMLLREADRARSKRLKRNFRMSDSKGSKFGHLKTKGKKRSSDVEKFEALIRLDPPPMNKEAPPSPQPEHPQEPLFSWPTAVSDMQARPTQDAETKEPRRIPLDALLTASANHEFKTCLFIPGEHDPFDENGGEFMCGAVHP
jgi:hypothetical protein